MNLKHIALTTLALTLPLAGAQAVVFSTSTYIGAGNTTYEGQPIVVSNCTLTVDGPHGFASLSVVSNAIVTHSPAPVGETNNRLDMIIAGDVTVDRTSAIQADGRGYGSHSGPGAGASGGQYLQYSSGGGYGGRGGSCAGVPGGEAYGSISEPTALGSGGAKRQTSEWLGGAGGGAIRLSAAGLLRLDGRMSANGLNGQGDPSLWGGAGGTGGSIWITADSLAGSGVILACGGNGHSGGGVTAGGGSGGRIALEYGTDSFGGTVAATGGTGGERGGAGTVYRKAVAQALAEVLVDNGGAGGAGTPLSTPAPFNLTIANHGYVYPTAACLLGNLHIASNAVLFQAGGAAAPDLTVLGDASLDAGGTISVDGMGYGSHSGPGAGASGGMYAQYASGGGHGGFGGNCGGVPGGVTYGSALAPTTPGSGGGMRANSQWLGGAGGGTIKLTVAGLLRVNGDLTADGLNGNGDPSAWGGAGGAGGSIWITAGSLVGSGNITAHGGKGHVGGGVTAGGGGGGRIAVYQQFPADPAFTNLTAAGGAGGLSGQTGSVLFSTNLSPMELISFAPSGTLRQAVSSVDVAFNQAVRAQTFTPEDVLITVPSGEPPHGEITVTPLSAASFRIGFGTQAAVGAYQVQLGPHIENLYGQEMAAAFTGSFTITNPVISGVVRWTNGAPLNGVLLSVTGGLSVSTDTNGAYALTVSPGWSGALTPTLAGWVFTPPSLACAILAADATNQNFAAQPTGYLPSGLLCWWRGENDASDTLGLHPGTPLGGLAYTNGPMGRAFALNGQDGAVAFGNWFTLQTFTLTLWVQPAPGQVTYADILDNNHTDYRSWCLQHDNLSDAERGHWHWGTSLPSGGGAIGFSLRHNVWQHWTLTLDTNRVQCLYLDGQPVGSTTNTAAVPYDGTQSFNLGKHAVYGRFFKGALDEVMLFDRALAPAEVTALYVSAGGQPTLAIQRQGGGVQVTWPVSNWLLQNASNLAETWRTITNGIQSTGSINTMTVPATNAQQFFRLSAP